MTYYRQIMTGFAVFAMSVFLANAQSVCTCKHIRHSDCRGNPHKTARSQIPQHASCCTGTNADDSAHSENCRCTITYTTSCLQPLREQHPLKTDGSSAKQTSQNTSIRLFIEPQQTDSELYTRIRSHSNISSLSVLCRLNC